MAETANRPLRPQSAELFAQADEAIAAIRVSHARIDRSLAEIFIAATSQPFPDMKPFGQGCSCEFGPRCESNRNCEDEAATMGVKDRRTGTIRARARLSFFHPFLRRPAPRVVFYCNDCFVSLKESWGKSIPGIDRPEHASDFWRPSIMAMLDHGIRAAREQQRKLQAPAYSPGNQPATPREKALPPAQWAQILTLRKLMRANSKAGVKDG